MKEDSKKELIISAFRLYEEEKQKERVRIEKERKKTALRNTELLLKNYGKLTQHADNAVFNIKHVYGVAPIMQSDFHGYNDEEEEIEGIADGTLYIDAILKSKARTVIMLAHIDAALTQLRCNAIAGGYNKKVDVLEGVYLKGRTFEAMAEIFEADVSTVRRWKNEVLRELSVLLYGVEGLNMAV